MFTDPRTVLGAHDAGAHVDILCDSCYPSYTLRYWVREEQAMTLERTVWRMSGQPAALWGLADLGTIEAGKAADLVTLDPGTIGETHPEQAWDFPTDGDRLTVQSKGIKHLWVNGALTSQNGTELKGATQAILVDSGELAPPSSSFNSYTLLRPVLQAHSAWSERTVPLCIHPIVTGPPYSTA